MLRAAREPAPAMHCLLAWSLTSALLAMPQGPRTAAATPTGLQFPPLPEQTAHAPFVDAAGAPLPTVAQRFGAIDLDGNRIADACWLGSPIGGSAQLAVAMGREHSPGRFRAWPVPLPALPPLADAAPIRQAWLEQDALLLAAPNHPGLLRLTFDLAPLGDPHTNGTFVQAPFAALPPRLGAVALATGNHDRDSCDDVLVAYTAGAGVELVKYRLDAPLGVPMLLGTAAVSVPLPVQHVRLCDVDGDGRGDAVGEVPGCGVFVARDDGSGQLQWLAAIPTGAPLLALATARFGSSDALGLAVDAGVLTAWWEQGGFAFHWLPAPAGGLGGAALLGDGRQGLDVVAHARSGHAFTTAGMQRGGTASTHELRLPADPAAWSGAHVPCAATAADLDGDGDDDLLLQHADGAHWCTVRNDRCVAAPRLLAMTQDLSLVTLGWYGATFTLQVPTTWDLGALPNLEVQVMLEHPWTGVQQRWDRLVAPIDPVTRRVQCTLQWQDSPQTTAAFLANPALVPGSFRQAGMLTAGRRTQVLVLGIGPGNLSWSGGERRTEPLILWTDPGGSGNKSAQGVVWEKRAAPPLPRADAALLPWQ
jgi:hypothetical protein